MDNKEIEFKKKILATFRMEAEEHVNAFSSGLIELEKTTGEKKRAELIETLFREIHSLKGAARSVDQRDVEMVCHPIESLFSKLKRNEITFSPGLFDTLFRAVKILTNLIISGGVFHSEDEHKIHKDLITRLNEFAVGPIKRENSRESKSVAEISISEDVTRSGRPEIPLVEISGFPEYLKTEVVRVKVSKLDSLLLHAEEMIQSKTALSQRIRELNEIKDRIERWKADILDPEPRVASGSRTLENEWLENHENHLNNLRSLINEHARLMERDQYSLDRMINDNLSKMKQILLLPASAIVESFPAMVRNIAREYNKEIEFFIQGAALEIDKRILDEIKDPLIHLLRNCIDHGIEKPEERLKNKKPSYGKIVLGFNVLENDKIDISITDDGRGINRENVLKAGIDSGIISKEKAEKLDQQEILSLIFQAGITTSAIITDLSGRGLGLSIVRENVEKLNGNVTVESEINRGTVFHIIIPVSLATFRGILVSVEEFMFLLPTSKVERVMKVAPDRIRTIENHETIRLGDQILPVADLGKVLGIKDQKFDTSSKSDSDSPTSNQINLVVLVSGNKRFPFKVDKVIEEQQVLVKGLGKILKHVNNISGASILGTGKVVPVIHVAELVNNSIISADKYLKQAPPQNIIEKIKNILIAEDSVTARTMLKNIFETAGYSVSTAVDGADAFAKARTSDFDIIVSDVDMPRMNGFELTSKIRKDKKLSEIPIVLVTALESREDRERGIEVGANAYIVKSSFDQANLLAIVKKLI